METIVERYVSLAVLYLFIDPQVTAYCLSDWRT